MRVQIPVDKKCSPERRAMGHVDVFFLCCREELQFGCSAPWVWSNVSHTALGATTPSSITHRRDSICSSANARAYVCVDISPSDALSPNCILIAHLEVQLLGVVESKDFARWNKGFLWWGFANLDFCWKCSNCLISWSKIWGIFFKLLIKWKAWKL